MDSPAYPPLHTPSPLLLFPLLSFGLPLVPSPGPKRGPTIVFLHGAPVQSWSFKDVMQQVREEQAEGEEGANGIL